MTLVTLSRIRRPPAGDRPAGAGEVVEILWRLRLASGAADAIGYLTARSIT
jgi:hypothetical protein